MIFVCQTRITRGNWKNLDLVFNTGKKGSAKTESNDSSFFWIVMSRAATRSFLPETLDHLYKPGFFNTYS